MSEYVLRKKWRPALWMVVCGALLLVALLPLTGPLVVILVENVTGSQFVLRSPAGVAMLAAGSCVIAITVGAIFLRTLLRPIHDLRRRTEEIEAGASHAFRPMDAGGTREVAALAERFFRSARRLSDRSNYLSLFTTHVSHELKTPLTSIQGAVELLREEWTAMGLEQRNHFLDNIADDARHLTALCKRLGELAHADVADTSGHCGLADVIRRCGKSAYLEVFLDGDVSQRVAISEANAMIVWQRFAENAKQNGATKLTVQLSSEDGALITKISDDGKPLSKTDGEKIFDPFFTTRREEGGTGLGLAIAQAMLRSHGGTVELCHDPGIKFEVVWRCETNTS